MHAAIQLRSLLPGRLPPRKATSTPLTPPATPRKRSTVLASLQRTLSPRRGQSNSLASLSAKESKSIAIASIDYHELGTLLSTVSHDSVVRSHTAWRSFFVVRKDDLQSARVEKRIKRTKSDATTHLAPPRASSEFAAFGAVAPRVSGLHPIEGSNSTDDTSIEVDTTGAQHLSLFPLPAIPSSKLDFQASDHDGAGERRVASSSTDMTDGTTSTDAAAVLELPTPPPLAQADPIATAEVVELPSRPRTAPAEDELSKSKEDAPRGSRRIEVPTPAGATLEPLKSPARSRTASKSAKPALTIDSFEIMRVLGKGCAGKVLLVKQKDSDKFYALKAIHKQHVRFPLVRDLGAPKLILISRRSSPIASSLIPRPSKPYSRPALAEMSTPSSSSSTTPSTTKTPSTSLSTSTPEEISLLSSRDGDGWEGIGPAFMLLRLWEESRDCTRRASSTGE